MRSFTRRLTALLLLVLGCCLLAAGCQSRPDMERPTQIPAQVEDTEEINSPYMGRLDSLPEGSNLLLTNTAAPISRILLYQYSIPTGSGFSDKLYALSNAAHDQLQQDDSFIFALDPAHAAHKFIIEAYDGELLLLREMLDLDLSRYADICQIKLNHDEEGYSISIANLVPTAPPAAADPSQLLFSYQEQELALGRQEGAFPWGYDFSEKSRQTIWLEDEHYGAQHLVDCGDIELLYLTSNDDGTDYLASVWSSEEGLTTYRDISAGADKEQFFSAYAAEELSLMISHSPGSLLRFSFDDGYTYYLHNQERPQMIRFYFMSGLLQGIEISDANLLHALPSEKGDGQLEGELYRAYFQAAGKADAESRARVFELLPQADWSLYQMPAATNQSIAAMDLFTWVWSIDDLADHELQAVMAALPHTDGAVTEGTGYFLGTRFKAEPERFLSILAQTEAPALPQTIWLIACELYLYSDTPWQEEISGLNQKQQYLLDLLREKGSQLLLQQAAVISS
jgi:hypothetical protein